ncbi:MAG TPA: hypothetical protein VGP73_06080 [Thermoanaerobaculia bacterium]
MKARRLLLCVLALALTLFASNASANPALPCDEVCSPDTPCSTRCSVWYPDNTYQNVTCAYVGNCSF